MTMTLTVSGQRRIDLALALEEVARFVMSGYSEGSDQNDTWHYHFKIEGDPEPNTEATE